MLKRGFGELELPRAAALARLLGGSIAWLAGRKRDPGDPPTGEFVLDSDAVRRLRRERTIPSQTVCDHLGLTTNEWRRLLERRDHPRLRELIELAGLLATHPDDLLMDAP